MVIIDIIVDEQPKSLYMDNRLHTQLTQKVKSGVNKKDKDWVCVVDGEEGSGKSVLSQQIAKVLDPTFDLSRMCMTPDQFTKAIIYAKKGQCVIFDEAFTGLSSRAALSEINKLIVSMMMEMRQKNLFVIIVMPTFFLLDKYVAIWRAKGVFHVYTKNGNRGQWTFFNKANKKLLYILGKQLYDYSKPKTDFYGRFHDQYTVNEQEYREKKRTALIQKSRITKAEKLLAQRNVLIQALHEHYNLIPREIATVMKDRGQILTASTIKAVLADKQGSSINKMIDEAYYDKEKHGSETQQEQEGSQTV